MPNKATFFLILGIFFGLNNALIATRNAPITKIGLNSSCMGTQIVIPVLVNGFTNITAISLRIEYTNSVLTYVSAMANPVIGNVTFNSTPVTGNLSLNKLIIAWSNIIPKSLNQNDTLAWLTFNYIAGITELAFNNTSNFGGDCEYGDENGDPMNDMPSLIYYQNGQLQPIQDQLDLKNITILSGQPITYKAIQSINTAGNGTTVVIQNGGNVTLIAGHSIKFLSGTWIQTGGYLHSFISNPCAIQNSSNSGIIEKVVDSEITLNSRELLDEFSIFPNPAKEKLNVAFLRRVQNESIDVEVYSLHGKKLIQKNISGNNCCDVYLVDIPVGVYIIKIIKADGGIRTLKFIKN